MKKECDANGLEYELLMQESTKDRFLREVKGSTFDLKKHLVVLKQKRESDIVTPAPTVGAAPTEPTVGATVSSTIDPVVGNTQSTPPASKPEVNVGMPLTGLVATLNGKSAIAGTDLKTSKLLVLIRERFANSKPAPTSAPFVLPKVSLPTITPRAAPSKFSLPDLKNLPSLPSLPGFTKLGSTGPKDLVVQPATLQDD